MSRTRWWTLFVLFQMHFDTFHSIENRFLFVHFISFAVFVVIAFTHTYSLSMFHCYLIRFHNNNKKKLNTVHSWNNNKKKNWYSIIPSSLVKRRFNIKAKLVLTHSFIFGTLFDWHIFDILITVLITTRETTTKLCIWLVMVSCPKNRNFWNNEKRNLMISAGNKGSFTRKCSIVESDNYLKESWREREERTKGREIEGEENER